MRDDPDRPELVPHPEDAAAAHSRRETVAIGAAVSSGSVRALPDFVGAYRILRLLGQGGMGAVYLAEQHSPHRVVALKVIKPGLATDELLRRFAQEANALGRLQHPGIAQIYEAGTADRGYGAQPYFAMEFIEGTSLREYADRQQLSPSRRLELMARICDAVQHAHQRGIIHRDLKPGNILVDAAGDPKILDFGVARVADGDTPSTRHTDLGQVVGTLAYMSPEQVLGDPLELDTRSDVYALGVIVYELLSGRLPHAVSGQLHEAVRTIVDEDPIPLGSINRNYRGDIAVITAKALEKDKTRRYASAADLAGDIRRYLRDEPILAAPPSATYQLQKFARRHKALVGAIAAVFAALLIGAVVSTREAIRANRAEREAANRMNEARQEAAKARAVNVFMEGMLRAANPRALTKDDRDKGREVTVLQVLDGAARQLDAGMLHAQPLVEAAARESLGTTFSALGSYEKAEHQFRTALGLRRLGHGDDTADVSAGMSKVAGVLRARSKLTEAEALERRALRIRLQLFGPQHTDVAESMYGLAEVLVSTGKMSEAEDLYRRALAIDLQTGSPHAHEVAHSLGVLQFQERRLAEAEASLRQALALAQDVLGDEHPDIAVTMNQLAYVYHRENKLAESERYARASLAMSQRFYGKQHPDVAIALGHLAGLFLDEGKIEEAESTYREALALSRQMLGDEHEQTATLASNLGRLLLTGGRRSESVALFREAMETRAKVLPRGHWRVFESQSWLGEALARDGDFQRAEQQLLAAYDGLKTQSTAPAAVRRAALEHVAELYRRWNEQQPRAGKRDVAAAWRARVNETPK
jgi:serine/threonine protein kinase/Tfp pilus assembly protein PilF